WAFSTGLSFVRTLDPAVLFANINFFHNFEGDFDNIGGNTPTPGTVDLGNAYQFGLGMAFALNERLSMNFSYTQRFTDKARIKAKGGEWESIIGSDANIATLNMGVTFALTQHLTVVTNVGVGLTTDAPDVQLGIKLPYRF
ncbi:MAG: transporter, partial [Gammaproteobacteria bacterium]